MQGETNDPEAARPRPTRFLLTVLGFESGLAAIAVVLALIFGLRPWLELHWQGTLLPVAIAATLPVLALLPIVTRSRQAWALRLRRLVDESILPLFTGQRWWGLALIALAAGVGEELLFRGVLQSGLTQLAGPAVALVAASLLFGLAHALTPAYFVLATLIGLYLGALYLATGNLLVPILVHFLYDWIALAWLQSGRSRNP